MKPLLFVALMVLSGSIAAGADLPRSSPESQGVSSSAVQAFVEAADKTIDSMNSFMLLRHGHVVAEGWWSPYRAEFPHSLYSLSKSFTSTAVGLAIAEGKFGLDDPVLKFFPEDAPAEPSENLKAMRVRDLLTMSTGHATEPPRPADRPWTRAFLAHAVPHKPGAHFLYNTSATYMLSAIVQKTTGKTLLEYLRPRLFDPLGIEAPTWESSPQGISTGGYGLSVRTEDIARFGQLYLQKGQWQGKSLLPADWVETATGKQVSNDGGGTPDWRQGYGFQFWRCRHGAYRGDGAFGQFCVVLPEVDAVVVITSGVKDMQAVLNLVWDKLLPAFKSEALAPDDAAAESLRRTLKGLTLPPQMGSGHAPKVLGKTYTFASNPRKLEAIALEGEGADGDVAIVAKFNGATRRIACGSNRWRRGHSGWDAFADQPIAASGGWTDDGGFQAKVCFTETPFVITLNLKFAGDELSYRSTANVGFGPTASPPLVGKLASAAVTSTDPDSRLVDRNFGRWEEEIAKFETADRANPPVKGGVLFVGSSTVRLWKTLPDDFPNSSVINRGFGGCEIVDVTHFADRIIFPYEPRQIFLRAGGNDINGGRVPKEVVADFADFVMRVRVRLPKTEILFIGLSPAPSRWGENDKIRALNGAIREKALDMSRVGYIDAYDISLTSDGRGRPELFLEDRLHFNPDGYKLLVERVRPYVAVSK